MASWDAAFEANPGGSTSPSLGDDVIREFKTAVRERMAKEHILTTGTGTAANHGYHAQGAALAYYTATKPTVLPDGTALASDAKSKGRLWIKSGSYMPMAFNGSTWLGIDHEITRVSIQGTLAIGDNALPPIIFPRTVSIVRALARAATRPGTAGNPIYINLTKRCGATASMSVFSSGTARLMMSTGTSYSLRTSGQMSAGALVIQPNSWLQVDLDAVGGSTKAADLSLVIEVVAK